MNLDERLNSRRLWKSLEAAFNKNRDNNWDEFDIAGRIRDDLGIESNAKDDIRRIFEQQVIDQLPRPTVITADELAAIAIEQLVGVPLEATECGNEELQRDVLVAKNRFLAFVNAAFPELEVESSQFVAPFDLGYWLSDNVKSEMGVVDLGEIWPSKSEPSMFRLYGNAEPLYSFYRAKAELRGCCSDGAMEIAAKELSPVVESIARTIRLSGTKNDGYDDQDEFQIFGPHSAAYVPDGKRWG